MLADHAAPFPGCGCGFNAFHLPRTGERHARSLETLAAIAAWGEIDVYASGFRASHAQVIAIGFHSKTTAPRLDALRGAAARYGVPLVPYARLSAVATEFASPAGPALMPAGISAPRAPAAAAAKPLPPLPQPPPFIGESLHETEGASVWIGRHVAAQTRAGRMRVGPTPALASLLVEARTRSLRGEDQTVAEGDPLWVLDAGGIEVALPSPAAGTVVELNYEGLADPESLLGGPRRGGWIAEIELAPAPLDQAPLTWGRAGAEQYRQFVLAAADDALILHDIERSGGAGGLADVRMRRSDFDARWRSWRSRLPESPSYPHGRRAAAAVADLRQLLETIGGIDPGDLMAPRGAAA